MAFSRPPAGARGYDEDEVDAFVERVQAALRDPTRQILTAEQVRDTVFSKPRPGRRGYSEKEVDAYLARVEAQLAPAGHTRKTHYVLYTLRGADGLQPAVVAEVDGGALRLTDSAGNELLGTALLAEVTVRPANHGGIPVMIVEAPGLETLTIRPHLAPKDWRRRTRSKKPKYFMTDEDWVSLAEDLGAGPDLVDEFTPQTFVDQVLAFFEESGDGGHWTWRTFLVFGVLALVLTFFVGERAWMFAAGGAGLLLVSAAFWRFNWRF